jgi:hypothetical protein
VTEISCSIKDYNINKSFSLILTLTVFMCTCVGVLNSEKRLNNV